MDRKRTAALTTPPDKLTAARNTIRTPVSRAVGRFREKSKPDCVQHTRSSPFVSVLVIPKKRLPSTSRPADIPARTT
jgi:hypothetical protein